jgi:HSP20 family protein
MADQDSRPPGRRSSGAITPHLADELEVYFYETDELFVVAMDIAGVAPDGFSVTFDAGILSVSGERREQASGRREYHAMEVKVGPFERRFRFPKRVDPASLKATYELGFLEIRLTKVAERPQPVRVDVEAK